MKKIHTFALIFMVLATGCTTQNNSDLDSDTTLNFPDDFVLKSEEVPKGFEIRPIDESANEAGVVSNPGYVENPDLLNMLYNGVDSTLIDKVYSSVYLDDSGSSQDVGVIAVSYKSKEALNDEVKKIQSDIEQMHAAEEGKKFLKRENYLVLVWSDAASHSKEVQEMSDALKERLHLDAIE